MNIETAKKLISDEKYKEAYDMLLKIKNEASAGNTDLNFEIAKIKFLTGDYCNAAVEFEKILKVKFNYNAIILSAKSYKEAGKFRNSIKILLRAKKQQLSEAERREINDLIISLLCHFGHKEIAVKFMKKVNVEEGYGRSPDVLCKDCVGDMTDKNLKGITLKNYGKIIGDIENIKLKNAMLNEYEISEKKTVLASMPRRLRVFLTNSCNLRCKMCEVVKYEKQQIPDSKIRELRELLPYLEDVIWMGGEVFLYPGFMDLLKEAGRYGIKQSLSTNGTLITDSVAEQLCRYDVETTFSIDSIYKKTYECIRQGADFDAVTGNIKIFNFYKQKRGANITCMHYVISKYNYDESLENVVNFALENKFNKLVFIIDTFAENDIKKRVIAKYSTIRKRLDELCGKSGIQVVSHVPFEYAENAEHAQAAYEPKQKSREEETAATNKEESIHIDFDRNACGSILNVPYCFLPWKMLTIDANYAVRSDCFCHELGNYEKEKLTDIWNNKQFVNLRRSILAGNKICNPVCYNSNRKFY